MLSNPSRQTPAESGYGKSNNLFIPGEAVVVTQWDPASPLHSITSFQDLSLGEDLLKGIYDKKFERPSKIQEHALPLLLRDPPEHLIAQSQSGTGKTAAFSLAVLRRIDYSDPGTQAIVLAPTRELARQIVGVMKELAKFTSATITPVIRQEILRRVQVAGQVIVGTPGTVMDLVKRRHISAAKVKLLVLDEADYMLDLQGLRLQTILFKRLLPRNIQLVMFSATWGERVISYTKEFISAPANQIRLPLDKQIMTNIKQFYVDCDSESDRLEILSELYSLISVSQSIIFVKRRNIAERITAMMEDKGHAVSFLHGALSPDNRDDRIDMFRSAKFKILITTNVLARGIDISNVNLVINYDVPTTPDPDAAYVKERSDRETYLHRIGRTGRFGRLGVCVNFVHNRGSFEMLNDIREYFECTILQMPTNLLMKNGVALTDQKAERLERLEAFFKEHMKL
ncbi:RNA helicase required for poly(A+) mRNA export [Mortierella polycephala]|uniref:RNA helicase n=1 Tax=Mortierella polycephala TaxID=41804 RepID=A0A9P6U8Q7_9FUNG|nr:RNA helicase required for poly(A+) mRNA export [Mortierella polycephala]